MKKRKSIRELNPKQRELLLNTSVSPDIVGVLLHMRPSEVTDIRYRQKFKPCINAASKRYRTKLREEEMKKFKKPYGSRNLWTQEEELQLLELHFNGVTDREIAEILNRSTYSISKKRERILRDFNYEEAIKTIKTTTAGTD